MPPGTTPRRVVRLNVGGTIFETSTTTLCQGAFYFYLTAYVRRSYKSAVFTGGGFFERLLSGEFNDFDESGVAFIDRDPSYFRCVLQVIFPRPILVHPCCHLLRLRMLPCLQFMRTGELDIQEPLTLQAAPLRMRAAPLCMRAALLCMGAVPLSMCPSP